MKTNLIAYAFLGAWLEMTLSFAAVAQEQTDTGLSPRTPSKYIDLLRKPDSDASARKMLAEQLGVPRIYSLEELSPLNLERDDLEDPSEGWETWFLEVRKVLGEVGILEEPLGWSSLKPSHRSVEFDLYQFEYHEKGEKNREEGVEFVTVRVMIAVSRSSAFEDINRVYYVMRRLLPIQLATRVGMFDDSQAPIGDACYHRGGRAIAFCRGNVVVEINVSPRRWVVSQDGRMRLGGGIDDAWREKMVEAARRIDQLLLEKMFDEKTRATILAAEEERAAKQSEER